MRYVARELSRRQIAYLHVHEPDGTDEGPQLTDDFRRDLRERLNATLIYCGHETAKRAEALIDKGLGDAAAFGRPDIAHSDLVERFRRDAILREPNPGTFYGGGAEGYTDYPVMD